MSKKAIALDPYIPQTLLRDLVGHDRKPSAFLVYLHLFSESKGTRPRRVERSHETISQRTGLSKSAVQAAIRHLLWRKLLRMEKAHRTATPVYFVLKPWVRRKRIKK